MNSSDQPNDISTLEADLIDEDLATLTASFNNICSRANTKIASLPRATRSILTKQTHEIFTKYSNHGSEARLAHNINNFLSKDAEDLSLIPIPAIPLTSPTLRTNDLESTSLVTTLPFHLDLDIELKATAQLPSSLLPIISRITSLYNLLAHALLTHHTTLYGPEPIFRAGIREYIHTQLGTILKSTRADLLSLTPETRTFLRTVYETHGPELNDLENRLLARACRIDVDSVDLFFEDLENSRKAWRGMRTVVAAKEIEKMRREKEAVKRREEGDLDE